MASNVEIANSALTKIGSTRITALTDNVKAAREINAIFELRRDYLLRTHNFIAGRWLPAQAGALLDVVDPATLATIAASSD